LGGGQHELGIKHSHRDLPRGCHRHVRQLKNPQREAAEILKLGRDDFGMGASLQMMEVAAQMEADPVGQVPLLTATRGQAQASLFASRDWALAAMEERQRPPSVRGSWSLS
jgi:hypothetical protein